MATEVYQTNLTDQGRRFMAEQGGTASSRMDPTAQSRIDSSMRAKQNFQRLPGSSLWVLGAEVAAQTLAERYAPRPGQQPTYIASGNEQRILADLVRQGIPVVLAGPPGIGKMTLVRSVFHRLGMPLQTFVASTATQSHQLLGKQGAAGSHGELMAWVDGTLSLAARAAAGGLINGFYLDELIKLPPDITSYLFNVIDGRQTMALPTGEEIDTAGNLRMVFSYSPTRDMKLDDSLRARLAAIRLTYPACDVEIRVLRDNRLGGLERLSQGEAIAEGLVQFANIIRGAHGYEVDLDHDALSEEETRLLRLLPAPPSTRTLVIAARMIALGKYGSIEAAKFFILPSMLQDTHDFDLPQLTALLHQMTESLIPDVAPFRRATDLGDVDTLFDLEEDNRRKEGKTVQVSAQVTRDWSSKKVS